MTEYAADTDGATVCVDCLHGGCVAAGAPCEAEACMCECNRAPLLDARPLDKLHVIANELEREARPAPEELTAERFGGGRRG